MTVGGGFAYTGCFTTEQRRARGNGITAYAVDTTGDWRQIQHVPGLVNPSYLFLGPGGRTLYSVHGDRDYVSSYARDLQTGMLRPLGQAASGGSNGVHGALDPSGRFFVAANYATGSVSVLPLRADGGLGDFIQRTEMPGTPGPDRAEQASAHPHQVLFDPSCGFVLVPDKGHDAVCIFAFNAEAGSLALADAVRSRPGAGPRHGAFHPSLPIYWVLNELDSSITTYDWSNGSLRPRQVVPTLPPRCVGASTAAAIVVTADGRYVFASNRGDHSVAGFAADPADGTLRSLGWTAAPGGDPRFMTLHDGKLYVASERDDAIGRFVVDAETGTLAADGLVARTPSPVSIVFA